MKSIHALKKLVSVGETAAFIIMVVDALVIVVCVLICGYQVSGTRDLIIE